MKSLEWLIHYDTIRSGKSLAAIMVLTVSSTLEATSDVSWLRT